MARADRTRRHVGASPKPRTLALLISQAMLLAGAAQAQSQAPTSLPTDVRYAPVQGSATALTPRQPGADDLDAARVLPQGAYAANAAVGQVLVDVDRNAVPADGQSTVQLTLRLLDRRGQPLSGASFVTVEHSGGRLKLDGARTDEFGPRALDADRAVPGVQIAVKDGLARLTLIAPAEAQDVRLRVTAGSAQASGTISFVPELRPMIAAGLLEGIVNFRNKTLIAPVRRGDAFEQELSNWSREFNNGKANAAARAAFFIKGTISGNLLLTAAYDSDKETRARLLVEEMASQGSGPYGLRNSGAVEGSEKVEMVVRDRFQPARIIAVKPLQRLVDYSFEPFSGRLLLSQFMPSVDSDLNPVSLRITYEVDQGGDKFWVYGADVAPRPR